MVKGRSSKEPSSSQSQSTKRNKSIAKSQKTNKKEEKKAVSSKQSNKKGKIAKNGKSKKGDEDEEMDVEEEKEVSEEVEMIDTSKRRGGKKRAESLPKVGQKRMRNSKKKTLEESEEASHGVDEDGSFDEGDSQPVKKRKIGPGKEKAEKKPKAKKAPKRPTEFKKGRWNPDIQLVDIDKYKESP